MNGSVVGLIALVSLSAGVASCGAAQSEPGSATARDTASVQARLVAGPWRLVDYHPDIALEPMLQMLLAQQLTTPGVRPQGQATMVVRFDGQRFTAASPTVQITRPYTLSNVGGLSFDVVSPDLQGGGTLQSHCEMTPDGRRVQFRAQTEPWNGTGTIEREGP